MLGVLGFGGLRTYRLVQAVWEEMLVVGILENQVDKNNGKYNGRVVFVGICLSEGGGGGGVSVYTYIYIYTRNIS